VFHPSISRLGPALRYPRHDGRHIVIRPVLEWLFSQPLDFSGGILAGECSHT
jgi:hypothetical protein